MPALQIIINKASTIQFDRRKTLGIQYSRSEIAKVSETPTRNPWRMNVSLANFLPYSTNRDLLEQIDYLDRRFPELISFSGNDRLKWICSYQGAMTTNQIADIRLNGFTGNQLILQNLPTVNLSFPSTTLMFKAGDFIQIAGYPHPFTVVNDVQRGNGSTITVTTHRPNFISATVQNLGILVGSNVSFKMFCPNMPTYKLVPGGTRITNGTMTNNALIEWSGEFQFYEWTGDV